MHAQLKKVNLLKSNSDEHDCYWRAMQLDCCADDDYTSGNPVDNSVMVQSAVQASMYADAGDYSPATLTLRSGIAGIPFRFEAVDPVVTPGVPPAVEEFMISTDGAATLPTLNIISGDSEILQLTQVSNLGTTSHVQIFGTLGVGSAALASRHWHYHPRR